MNTPSAGTPSNNAHFTAGNAHGRYQITMQTKDGRLVTVCRCCRNRNGTQLFLASPPSSTVVRTPPNSQPDFDHTIDSPEVCCLCLNLEGLKIDAPRRSMRLSKAGK